MSLSLHGPLLPLLDLLNVEASDGIGPTGAVASPNPPASFAGDTEGDSLDSAEPLLPFLSAWTNTEVQAPPDLDLASAASLFSALWTSATGPSGGGADSTADQVSPEAATLPPSFPDSRSAARGSEAEILLEAQPVLVPGAVPATPTANKNSAVTRLLRSAATVSVQPRREPDAAADGPAPPETALTPAESEDSGPAGNFSVSQTIRRAESSSPSDATGPQAAPVETSQLAEAKQPAGAGQPVKVSPRVESALPAPQRTPEPSGNSSTESVAIPAPQPDASAVSRDRRPRANAAPATSTRNEVVTEAGDASRSTTPNEVKASTPTAAAALRPVLPWPSPEDREQPTLAREPESPSRPQTAQPIAQAPQPTEPVAINGARIASMAGQGPVVTPDAAQVTPARPAPNFPSGNTADHNRPWPATGQTTTDAQKGETAFEMELRSRPRPSLAQGEAGSRLFSKAVRAPNPEIVPPTAPAAAGVDPLRLQRPDFDLTARPSRVQEAGEVPIERIIAGLSDRERNPADLFPQDKAGTATPDSAPRQLAFEPLGGPPPSTWRLTEDGRPSTTAPHSLAGEVERIQQVNDRTAAHPVRSIALQIHSEDRGTASVLLADRAGNLHLTVRAADNALTQSLRSEITSLTSALEQQGFEVKASKPAWFSSGEGAESEARAGGEFENSRRQHRHRQQWDEQPE
jgi:hypothetical protein